MGGDIGRHPEQYHLMFHDSQQKKKSLPFFPIKRVLFDFLIWQWLGYIRLSVKEGEGWFFFEGAGELVRKIQYTGLLWQWFSVINSITTVLTCIGQIAANWFVSIIGCRCSTCRRRLAVCVMAIMFVIVCGATITSEIGLIDTVCSASGRCYRWLWCGHHLYRIGVKVHWKTDQTVLSYWSHWLCIGSTRVVLASVIDPISTSLVVLITAICIVRCPTILCRIECCHVFHQL